MHLTTSNTDLTLRSWKLADAENCSRYANNHSIWKFMRDEFPHPFTPADAQNYIHTVCQKHPDTRFAIVYRNEVIGDIHLTVNDDIRRFSAMLGYWIGEPFRNKGFTTEAVSRITRYAFEDLKLVRIYAKLFETNTSSTRVLEKTGFKLEGIFKQAVFKEDQFLNQVQYAKIGG